MKTSKTAVLYSLLAGLFSVSTLASQESVRATISLPKGGSILLGASSTFTRVVASNPEVAEVVVVSPTEVMLNSKSIGTTNVIIWESNGLIYQHPVEVVVDAVSLQHSLRTLFVNETVLARAVGNVIVLSGTVADPTIARQAVQIAEATGATVLDNIEVVSSNQVLLQVRFAEVSRSSAQTIGMPSFNVRLSNGEQYDFQSADGSLSDALNIALITPGVEITAVINAMKQHGIFRSLAEPNLMALNGKEASFLAGGEFPFPIPQGGDKVGVQFKEFGVRLKFTPVLLPGGKIRLKVSPEVSSLDFANSLNSAGFRIPSILTRRAETEVELFDGQSFAIAGLIDQSLGDNVEKVPFLGDVPILGRLFKSTEMRERRTELLVIVTPRIVSPNTPVPPLPTGEPETWRASTQQEKQGSAPPVPLSSGPAPVVLERGLAPVPRRRRHVVGKGDTLMKIAEYYQISIGSLIEANFLQGKDINHIEIGQTLIIPTL